MDVEVDTRALVDLAARLVAADTRNPPGAERAAVDVVRPVLKALGARCREVEPQPGRTSLIARVDAARPDAPTLLVNGHLDVVPADASRWSSPPFAGAVVAGRLVGRGAADMKGGVACAVAALAALRRAGERPACHVELHLVADEERGGALGTAALVRRGLVRGDACLIPEPTRLRVCLAEAGVLWLAMRVRGRPGHAAMADLGRSAIAAAAEVVAALHGPLPGEHPLIGPPVLNVGTIAGGDAPNVVAGECVLGIDRRTLPGESDASAVAGVRALLPNGLDYELTIEDRCDAWELSPSHPFARLVADAVERELGGSGAPVGARASSDARLVRGAGIPTVVCGPGSMDDAHTVDEAVAIDELERGARLYAAVYRRFGAG